MACARRAVEDIAGHSGWSHRNNRLLPRLLQADGKPQGRGQHHATSRVAPVTDSSRAQGMENGGVLTSGSYTVVSSFSDESGSKSSSSCMPSPPSIRGAHAYRRNHVVNALRIGSFGHFSCRIEGPWNCDTQEKASELRFWKVAIYPAYAPFSRCF